MSVITLDSHSNREGTALASDTVSVTTERSPVANLGRRAGGWRGLFSAPIKIKAPACTTCLSSVTRAWHVAVSRGGRRARMQAIVTIAFSRIFGTSVNVTLGVAVINTRGAGHGSTTGGRGSPERADTTDQVSVASFGGPVSWKGSALPESVCVCRMNVFGGLG